jgi:hypothetical protein
MCARSSFNEYRLGGVLNLPVASRDAAYGRAGTDAHRLSAAFHQARNDDHLALENRDSRLATSVAVIMPMGDDFVKRMCSTWARRWKSVAVGPGQSAVTNAGAAQLVGDRFGKGNERFAGVVDRHQRPG